MLYRLFESLYKLYKIDLAPFWSSTQKHLHLSFGFTNAGYSNLETCFSCHAWDLTIHDLFLLKTGTRSGWRRLAIHLILVFHLLRTELSFPISIYISSVYLPFPIIFFVFFSLQRPHHFIPFTWVTHSDLTIQSTIISSLLMSKRTTTLAIDGTANLFTVSEYSPNFLHFGLF